MEQFTVGQQVRTVDGHAGLGTILRIDGTDAFTVWVVPKGKSKTQTRITKMWVRLEQITAA